MLMLCGVKERDEPMRESCCLRIEPNMVRETGRHIERGNNPGGRDKEGRGRERGGVYLV